MIYTTKIKNAIRFSIETHEVDQKQKRKGKDIAYVTHPLTVGIILSLAGADEDTVVAGILHDTVEDSANEKKVTKEILEERFGTKVAELVLSVTEQNRELSWEERKIEALKHIEHFSNDSVLVKSADIIGNSTELIDDYEIEGEAVFERFNASKDKILTSSLRVIDALITKWPESPLAGDLHGIAMKLGNLQDTKIEFYLTEEELKKRKIVYVACEDEDTCGFLVEFKHPNCTFYYCKDHKAGFNIDLTTVNSAGVECEIHGKMERYNVLTEDNLCPACNSNTLAILSTRI